MNFSGGGGFRRKKHEHIGGGGQNFFHIFWGVIYVSVDIKESN